MSISADVEYFDINFIRFIDYPTSDFNAFEILPLNRSSKFID